MYIKFKNGEEATAIEPKRGLIGVEFKHSTNYVTIKKPIDTIRFDKDERIHLVFLKTLKDLSISQFIIDGQPNYIRIHDRAPLKIDKLIVNAPSYINDINKSSVNEIVVMEGVSICIHLESVNVVTSHGRLGLSLTKETFDREKSHISKETYFNFDVKRDADGKILFLFDQNYGRLSHNILGPEDEHRPEFESGGRYSPITYRHKVIVDKLDKIKRYPKKDLKKYADGEAIHQHLLEKWEKHLAESIKELADLRNEIGELIYSPERN